MYQKGKAYFNIPNMKFGVSDDKSIYQKYFSLNDFT